MKKENLIKEYQNLTSDVKNLANEIENQNFTKKKKKGLLIGLKT